MSRTERIEFRDALSARKYLRTFFSYWSNEPLEHYKSALEGNANMKDTVIDAFMDGYITAGLHDISKDIVKMQLEAINYVLLARKEQMDRAINEMAERRKSMMSKFLRSLFAFADSMNE